MRDENKHRQTIEKQIVKSHLDYYIDEIVDTYITGSDVDFEIPNLPESMTERDLVNDLAQHIYRKHLNRFVTRSIRKDLSGEVTLEFKFDSLGFAKTLIDVMAKRVLVSDNRSMLNEIAVGV